MSSPLLGCAVDHLHHPPPLLTCTRHSHVSSPLLSRCFDLLSPSLSSRVPPLPSLPPSPSQGMRLHLIRDGLWSTHVSRSNGRRGVDTDMEGTTQQSGVFRTLIHFYDWLSVTLQTLGTPTEKTWPGITKNKDFMSFSFPSYHPQPLSLSVPRLASTSAHCMIVDLL